MNPHEQLPHVVYMCTYDTYIERSHFSVSVPPKKQVLILSTGPDKRLSVSQFCIILNQTLKGQRDSPPAQVLATEPGNLSLTRTHRRELTPEH